MSTFKKPEGILAWQKARFFCQELKKTFPLFIQAKGFDLLHQLKSSAGSAMDNIAEGFGTRGNNEFKSFLTICHGSIMELISQLYRSQDWSVISGEQLEYHRAFAEEAERLTFSLINFLIQSQYKAVKFK
jgi:four helix bundle protein